MYPKKRARLDSKYLTGSTPAVEDDCDLGREACDNEHIGFQRLEHIG